MIDTEVKYLKKSWIVYIFDGVLIAIVYLFGIYEFSKGNLQLGLFTAYLSTMTSFLFSILEIARTSVEISGFSRYILALNEYLKSNVEDMECETRNNSEDVEKTNNKITIEFQNVSFKYPNTEEWILKNISFKVQGGEKISIVGRNGAGKTTLIKILMTLYKPNEGKIFINSKDYLEYSKKEINDLFSVVLQDYGIYAFPIHNNISMSSNYDSSKISEVIKSTGLSKQVEKLQCGAESYITQRLDRNGIELSRGESQ